MVSVNTMSGKVKNWNQLVVTLCTKDLKFFWPPVGPMENAENPTFEFYFDYGKNVFQWTLKINNHGI